MHEFFAMGGHAFYVWGSWGGGALLLLGEVWLLRRARCAQLRRLRRAERMRES